MTTATEHSAAAIWRAVGGVLLGWRFVVPAKAKIESTVLLLRIKRIPKLVGVSVNRQTAVRR